LDIVDRIDRPDPRTSVARTNNRFFSRRQVLAVIVIGDRRSVLAP
jgi:hypothetical protein